MLGVLVWLFAQCVLCIQVGKEGIVCQKCKVAKSASDYPAKGGCCKRCCSKTATLCKAFNSWPPESFTKLPEDLQTDFWRGEEVSRAGMFARIEKQVCLCREENTYSCSGGSYRPLSWYEKQGYTAEEVKSIAVNSAQRLDPELGGLTFKLTVFSEQKEQIRKEVHQEMLMLRNTGIKGKLSHYCSPKTKSRKSRKSKKGGKKRSRSSSSAKCGSSSSSSSSSTNSKASKDAVSVPQLTPAQLAATKKAQEKADQLLEKENKAEAKKAAAKAKAAAKKAAQVAAQNKKQEAAQAKKKAQEDKKSEAAQQKVADAQAKEDWRCRLTM